MNYLQGHFERIEKRLTAEGELARSFDHSLHKGHIREAFVREFLGETISELWGVGTGEVLGSTEASSRQRQIDVVIHNRRYPKISLSAGTDLFFLETISSFVEIKSNLTKEHVRKAAQEIKSQVNRMLRAPARIRSYSHTEGRRGSRQCGIGSGKFQRRTTTTSTSWLLGPQAADLTSSILSSTGCSLLAPGLSSSTPSHSEVHSIGQIAILGIISGRVTPEYWNTCGRSLPDQRRSVRKEIPVHTLPRPPSIGTLGG